LRIALEGEGALESLAESADEAGQSTVRTEVVSSVINNMIEQEMVGSLPSLKPVVMKTEECTETGEHIISLGDYKINTARLEEALDYSCPITTDSAVKVAYIAVKNGNSKLAHIIADNISKHGTAPNSGDAYHTISAMALMADNKMKKAWDHAVQIDKNNAARYLTLGNILMHEGKYKKAISVMEKALSVDQKPHPLIYYNIASAYLTTGNYKKWKYFNDQFLKASVDAKLIPENLIEKLKKIEIFQ
jgi:tetratricopeptide (TPR) repeat protein